MGHSHGVSLCLCVFLFSLDFLVDLRGDVFVDFILCCPFFSGETRSNKSIPKSKITYYAFGSFVAKKKPYGKDLALRNHM